MPVEVFDQPGTSFVGITQLFSTTSMGRLTPQHVVVVRRFEREVTAERIRDKLVASKARGMWMGGVPPLGCRANGRSLAIVEPCRTDRHIFRRCLELGRTRLLELELKREQVRMPGRSWRQ